MTTLKGKQHSSSLGKLMPTLFFLQETHSCDVDSKFWKGQWGDLVFLFSCLSSLNKFTGNIIEILISEDGRWIIAVVKLEYSFHNL